MGLPRRSRLAAGLLGLAIVSSLQARPALAAAPDLCAAPEGSVAAHLQGLFDVATEVQTAPESRIAALIETAKNELASRATADGLAAGSRLDLLRRAFVALDLGTIKEEEGQLVFNFNPEALHLDSMGQFSPRVIVHEPNVYDAVDKKIDALDEDTRQTLRDALKKDLGDLDDLELKVRWTPRSQEPASDLQEVATALYDSVPKDPIAGPIADAKVAIAKALGLVSGPLGADLDKVEMKALCANAAAKQALVDLKGKLPEDPNAALQERLDKAGFFALADLVDGESRFVFDGSSRQRSGAAGPDDYSLNVTWQLGAISYRGAKRYALDHGKTKIDVDSVSDYFKANGRLKDSLPLFSFSASYSEVRPFDVPFPGLSDRYEQKASHKLSALLTAGAYFGGGRDRRLEFSASYDDVSDDPALTDRALFKLSWVEQLSPAIAQAVGGSEFVATLIYANKPEFRGDVQEDFGLRAGLKWSLGKKKDS